MDRDQVILALEKTADHLRYLGQVLSDERLNDVFEGIMTEMYISGSMSATPKGGDPHELAVLAREHAKELDDVVKHLYQMFMKQIRLEDTRREAIQLLEQDSMPKITPKRRSLPSSVVSSISPGDVVTWDDPDGGQKKIKVAKVSFVGDRVVLEDDHGGVVEALVSEVAQVVQYRQGGFCLS